MMPEIGIVGVGNLGMALGLRMRYRNQVWINDNDPAKMERAARAGLQGCSLEEMAAACKLIFLCVPPGEVASALALLGMLMGPDGIIVNLVTAEEIGSLRISTNMPHLIDLKLVGQFKAIEYGIPALFIADPSQMERARGLAGFLEGIGTIVFGNIRSVGRINEAATRMALHASREIMECLQDVCASEIERIAALKCVVVGTILDYPPAPDNVYIRNLVMTEPARTNK